MAWFSWAGSWTEPDGDSSEAFKLGEVVEYYSASQGSWIPAKVVAVNAKGTYDLDCKPGVPRQKIRSYATARDSRLSASAASGVLEFEPGEVVEYFSASQSDWILAKVLSINPNGTYNLDCKPDVPPERVRAQRDNELVRSPLQKLQKPTRLRQASTIFNLCQVQALEPVELLRVQRAGSRWQYEVCSEGAQALEAFGEKRIAVVSVCGMRGTGKSYLLNALLDGMKNGPKFKLGSPGDGTAGLWLWSYQDPEEEHAPVMAFLDCEGFGNDSDRDAQMMSLCALLSSVLVLNAKGTLNDSVFSSLAQICRFAEHMEERGQEVSRPALLWVLRDFVLELRDAAGHTMSSDEYLEQALHAADARGAGKE
ncbi:GBP2, partial [Symbiodinium sp. KB8]